MVRGAKNSASKKQWEERYRWDGEIGHNIPADIFSNTWWRQRHDIADAVDLQLLVGSVLVE